MAGGRLACHGAAEGCEPVAAAEAGDHASLLARQGIYAELFTLQAEGYPGR